MVRLKGAAFVFDSKRNGSKILFACFAIYQNSRFYMYTERKLREKKQKREENLNERSELKETKCK